MARMRARSNVAELFDALKPRAAPEDVRIAEAMVFASAEPLDEAANARAETLISTPASRLRVYVIPTDEERRIAELTQQTAQSLTGA